MYNRCLRGVYKMASLILVEILGRHKMKDKDPWTDRAHTQVGKVYRKMNNKCNKLISST